MEEVFFEKIDQITEDEFLIKEIKGKSVGVVKFKDEIKAYFNYCPHEGAEVCKGKISNILVSDGVQSFRLDKKNKVISCPWHGWEYNLNDGKGVVKNSRKLIGLKTKVREGKVYIII